MKQIFYKGLLALTIAFGVTSCDKNEMDDIAAPTVGVVENDNYSKVSFGEATGIAAPKDKASASASKNAADFAGSHVFAPATSPQVLTISKDGDVVYTGTYPAGVIGSISPASIILANGSYTAMSDNAANDGLGLVSSFAPYTSTVDFSLEASASIQLVVAHERGFVIADSQRAEGGLRITSVVLSQPAVGDVAATSGSLILDESDNFGDYYGYLEAGTYNVVVNYLRDGVADTAEGPIVITNGVASTLAPMLQAEADVTYATTTDTQSINEADLAGDDLVAYGNNDGDFLDSISRLVSSTITTTGGTAGEPVIENGSWSIVSDINVSASSATVTSTELAESEDVQPDGDEHDFIQRVVTTTVTSTDGNEVSNDVFGEWTLSPEGNRNSVSTNEDPIPGNFVAATYSVWAPAYDNNIADFTQTRSISNSEAGIDPAAEHDLERIVVISSEGGVESQLEGTEAAIDRSINSDGDTLDTLVRTITSDEVFTASFDLGSYTVVTAPSPWSIVDDNDAPAPIVARTYSAWGPAYADNIVDFSQSRTVTNDGAFNDPDVAVEALTRAVVAVYSVATAPEAGVAGVGTWTSMAGTVLVGTHNVDIAALPAADVDVTWTDSTVAGLTSYVGSDTAYNFGVAGSLNDVQISGIDFPEAVVITVPGYFDGAPFAGLPSREYTLQSANVLVIGAPIADVVALIQAAINQ